MKRILLISVLAVSFLLSACSKSSDSTGTGAAAPNLNDYNEGYTQIERLARPAINEGLVITNDYLNAFNSIPPSSDFSTAAAPVLTEAIAVLDVVTGLVGGGPTSAEVAGQFLPDVMRIDVTNANAGVGPSTTDGNVGYLSCVNGTGSGPLLCGGRKLQDDVIDITLTYIAAGAGALTNPYSVGDGVTYAAGHSALLGAFPYLAGPK